MVFKEKKFSVDRYSEKMRIVCYVCIARTFLYTTLPSLSLFSNYVVCLPTSAYTHTPFTHIPSHAYKVTLPNHTPLTLSLSLTSTVQQSSYYGLSSMLPPRYSQALLAGESVAGFVVAVNRIFTKLVFSERVGAIVFFVVSLLFVWLCVGCFVYIIRSPFVKYHVRKCREEKSKSKEHEMQERLEKKEDEENDEIEQEGSEGLLLQAEIQQSTLRQRIVGESVVMLQPLSV